MTPEEVFGLSVISLMAVWRGGVAIAEWFRELQVPPDPWGPEISERLAEPDSVPVCHHCFAPQVHDRWFCPECGAVVGPYNNSMPYLYIFSMGEVFRNGIRNRVKHTMPTAVFFVLYSLSQYLFFAPFYWYFFFQHWSTSSPVEDDNPPADHAVSPPRP